jgi:small subunit ribosomal protein S16
MALKIRLTRTGAKKRPSYRIVVADARGPRDGGYIERIGHYHPILARENPGRLHLDQDRARHWLERGAQPTERVARFLGEAGLIEFKHRDSPKKSQPKTKAQERAAAKTAAAAAAASAPEQPAAPAEQPAEPVAEQASEPAAEATDDAEG